MKKDSQKVLSFEESLKKLEEIVSKLENGDLPIEESMRLFEDGAALSIICSRKLEEIEQKILQISTDDNYNGGKENSGEN